MLQALKPDVLAYFGLPRDPFGRLRGGDFLQGSEFRRALGLVRYAIEANEIVALVGAVGAGKTETLRHVVEAIQSEARSPSLSKAEAGMGAGAGLGAVRFVRLAHPDKREARIMAAVDALLRELGVDRPAPSAQGRALQLLRLLAQEAAAPFPGPSPLGGKGERRHDPSFPLKEEGGALAPDGGRLCLIIDEAHRLSGGFLKSLKELHEGTRWGSRASLFSCVLCGHEELLRRTREVARDVHERLAAGNVAHFGRMTPQEVGAYIERRVQAAGGTGSAGLFDAQARRAVGRLAHSPLAINQVCSRLMEQAFVRNERTVSAPMIFAAFGRRDLCERLGLSLRDVAARAGLSETAARDALDGMGKKAALEAVDRVVRGEVKG